MSSKTNLFIPFAIFIISITFSNKSIAQEHQDGNVPDNHDYKSNHIALFGGATSNLHDHHTAFTIGADYEYRLNEHIGLGALGELITGDEKEIILGFQIVAHPYNGLKLLVAPIFIFNRVNVINSKNPEGIEEWHSGPSGYRAGAAYDLHLGNGNLTIGPAFNADFIENHVSLVYGVNIGIGF